MNRLQTLARYVVLAVLAAAPCAAAPPRGSQAPVIDLADLDGTPVRTDTLGDRTIVLIFGELTHDAARQACADTLDVINDPRLAATSVLPILVIAQDAPIHTLKEAAAAGRYPATVLHDPKREAFGAYHILVIPTIVVLDPTRRVANSITGPVPRFKDVLRESILLASGAKSEEQFQRSIAPNAGAPSPEAVRAERLVHLGDELARHGLLDLAESRYSEAVAAAPDHVGAKLGLATVLLRARRPAEAEALFRSVLAADPDSVDAALGLASVQSQGTAAELDQAQAAVEVIIARSPSLPKARYVLGLIYERRGNIPLASAQFKKAAELFIER